MAGGCWFIPEADSQILLTGYYDLENYYKAAQLVNNDTHEQITIRDITGRPLGQVRMNDVQ